MKRLCVLLSLLACTAAAQDLTHTTLQRTLLTQSSAAYQAVQDKNLAALQALVTPDVLEVAAGGLDNASGFPAMLRNCRITSFHLSEPNLRVLNATAAVLAYKVNQVSACGKKSDPPVTWNTDTFVYRKNIWLIAIHTEAGKE